MYFCVDSCNQVGVGKTILESWNDYENEFSDDNFANLKFYKGTEIKVELKEVTTVSKIPVATKKPMSKK